MTDAWRPGLERVVAARTSLTDIDGAQGTLRICGYSVEELAPAATFEETVYLLLHGHLPDPLQHADLRAQLGQHRPLPAMVETVLRSAVVHDATPIEALRLALDALHPTPDENALLSMTPTIVAAAHRLRQGLDLVAPAADADMATAFLHMLRGAPPAETEARALTTYLNTMVDHGLNASTFTARVITSTRADLRSAVVGALGALKGPLHGGAPEPVLALLQSIDRDEQIEPHLRTMLSRGERIMGFGHREYHVRDPRAQVLADAVESLAGPGADDLVTRARAVEATATRLLDEAKPGRNLRTNAEFYTAILLHQLDIEPQLFTAVFAISRMAGWIAHCQEQQRVDRIFRPTSTYDGPAARPWTPLAAR